MNRKSISTRERVRIFEAAEGVCHLCEAKIIVGDRWEVSHPIPLELGGADDASNRKPAHYKCHKRRTAEIDAPAIAKSRRVRARHTGADRPRKLIPGSKGSGWKKTFSRGWVRRDV